jgi:hypothetical protein
MPKTTERSNGKATAIAPVSNGAQEIIGYEQPYSAQVTIEGTAPILFHGYNVESVQEKAAAAKGSKAKKSDDVESYVYRTDDGRLGIPGLMFCAAIAHAGRRVQDPSSPRKSMLDLCKAAIIPLDDVASLQPDTEAWDYLDVRRVVVQRNAVPRERPAMRAGWRITFNLLVNAPEYINPMMLRGLITKVGKFSGLGDFRPTFGRFDIVGFETSEIA